MAEHTPSRPSYRDGQTRPIALTCILAMTHRMPVGLNTYLEPLAYFQQAAPSVLDDRAAVGEYIVTHLPYLRDIPRPNGDAYNAEPSEGITIAEWDRWADDILGQYGSVVTIPPIPADQRDRRSLVEKALDRGADPAKMWIIGADGDAPESTR